MNDIYLEEINDYNINECWDEDNNDFDWERYQYLCDLVDSCYSEE